ncbi:hypothetical protein D9619_009534 [Psilocybe cf. subviscida]|uniref:F-box domain-containing protein n=1 Tax=Psilocybe cf. subviscida TaxID=2480587 RepID=A0A8H5BN92_9AGAR|nr:hypothetical protein D9619_009534 [Psilocybe cf. subviscida]
MPALPLELIRQIVEDVVDDIDDPTYCRDLSAVSLSCRLLRHEAQRVLFRDSGELHTTTAAREKTIMFMDTIISSPERLALYVKSFDITFDDWFHPNSDETAALIQKLSITLQAMRNLESLDVSQWTSSVSSLADILQHVHSKLTSFIWSGYSDTASAAANIKADFLRRQDNIEHLVISEFIEERTLEPIAAEICPRLQSLSASYALTQILLPGKQHLTSLHWEPPLGDHVAQVYQGPDADFPCDLELISKELGRIRYLSYDVGGSLMPAGPNIRRIAPYLTSLVCLNTHRDDIKQLEALSRLPHLEILILSVGIRDSWPEEDDLIKVAASCKSLDHIDIENDYGAFSRFKYNHSSKSLESHTVDGSDIYRWFDDFDAFHD